ncbi:MAG: AAA family ATPase [bacterium]|nr:AAA family ATPase [bacterium]
MAGCPQDAAHHAEGDVAAHTELVAAALAASPAWQALPRSEREDLFAAALLHDVAKPGTTRCDSDGRITSPGHSRRGAVAARRILWELGWPRARRERICGLIRHHQEPFFIMARDDAERRAITMSWRLDCRHLALLAEADARGRQCRDSGRLLENIELFVEYARELDCLDQSYRFASDHSRFLYFRRQDRSPAYCAHDDTKGLLTVMCGLPAAGKDTWIRQQEPGSAVISLDDMRRELKVRPTDPQGPLAAEARERARVLLRRGVSFVWNATNISNDQRGRVIDLGADYGYRIRIVCAEADAVDLRRRNDERDRPVPAAALERMLERWEAPDLTEGHEVVFVEP